MGGWKMESFRFFTYVSFPVCAMWLFNQPFFYNWAFGVSKDELPEPKTTYEMERMRRFKEAMLELERKEDYARLLGEKMKAEEVRKMRSNIIRDSV